MHEVDERRTPSHSSRIIFVIIALLIALLFVAFFAIPKKYPPKQPMTPTPSIAPTSSTGS